MYYRFSTFYKRDTNFVYEQDLNKISWFNLRSGDFLEVKSPLIYKVDKIDGYINDYDFLPSIGIPLVSEKWKEVFSNLIEKDAQLIPVNIKDNLGNENNSFYALNILNSVLCLDKEKSVFDIDEDDDYDIKKFFISLPANYNNLIFRMEEHKSYIIVTEAFKNKCEEANLKGMSFIEEGHSIYTDV